MQRPEPVVTLGSVPSHRSPFRSRPVLWGWKRDAGRKSRIIFLAGEIFAEDCNLVLRCPHLFYRHCAAKSEILHLYETVRRSPDAKHFLRTHVKDDHEGNAVLTIELGCATNDTQLLIRKLMNRRPHHVPLRHLVPEWPSLNLAPYGPGDLYAGSGLSSEAGIPVLSAAHLAFGVDDPIAGTFLFGSRDPIPRQLANDPLLTLKTMVEIDKLCVLARPSTSHAILADLHSRGWVGKIFTDNIDDLFEQTAISPLRTRGTGLFNDPVVASFSPHARSLLVIGISADRRTLIRQARSKGLRIIVINPAFAVSPHSKNLDYLRQNDIFLCHRAEDVLPEIHKNLLASCSWPQESRLNSGESITVGQNRSQWI